MRFSVLGTGMVGQAIADRLVSLGHEVRMGSRDAANPKLAAWAAQAGPNASGGDFADSAAFGEVVFNCTAGVTSMEALEAAGEQNLSGKLLVDVANPVIITGPWDPPALAVCNTDSLAERIQRRFPDAQVVKTLNTINCDLMVDPSVVEGEHIVFLSGDSASAKARTRTILESFGWPAHRVVDLGDVTTARGPEMYLALFSRMFVLFGHAHFSIALIGERAPAPVS